MELFICLTLISTIAAEFYVYPQTFNQTKRSHKKYRPIYHITAPDGWISYPSGFAYFKGQYHIFYQFYPYNGGWGHMHWGHVISNNLVDWAHCPSALIPKDYYDRHGCLAGTAIVYNKFLTLFYTGHTSSGKKTDQTQNLAISGDGVIFKKYLYNPIIRTPNGVDIFRNPKVWRFRNTWYMLVGTTSKERNGELILYTSPDMFHWNMNVTVAESYGDMGSVWENPDLFEIDGEDALIISAEGIQTDGYRFRNLYQSGYVLGSFDYVMGKFEDDMEISVATFNELDFGHDFYAAKTMRAPDGRRLLIAWLGAWESDYYEFNRGWSSMLTLVRELRLGENDRLLMTPVREAVQLREEMLEDAWYRPGEEFPAGAKSFELIVNSSAIADVRVIFEWGTKGQFVIDYSSDFGSVSVDRGGMDGVRKADWFPTHHVHWRIFVDVSSVEVFCGDGEVVFSSRFYPKTLRVKIAGDTEVHIVQYKLRRSVSFDKKRGEIFNGLDHGRVQYV